MAIAGYGRSLNMNGERGIWETANIRMAADKSRRDSSAYI